MDEEKLEMYLFDRLQWGRLHWLHCTPFELGRWSPHKRMQLELSLTATQTLVFLGRTPYLLFMILDGESGYMDMIRKLHQRMIATWYLQ